METIVIRKIDNVYFKIEMDIGQRLELKEHLAVYTKSYKYHPKYKARIWDGKISFYNVATELLPIGLLPEFIKYCNKFDYQYTFGFDINEMSVDYSEFKFEEYYKQLFKGTDIIPYDYQDESIRIAMSNKRGVLELATGSGKSLVMYTVSRMLLETKRKILLIVPSTSLVEQLYSDFKDYGYKNISNEVTKLYSGLTPDPKAKILITTWQSIFRKQEKFFEKFGAVINDECHGLKANSLISVMQKCKNAEYRLGFTGTMPPDLCDSRTVNAYLGPTLKSLKSKVLMDRGILSKIMIANVKIKYPEKFIQKNKGRNYQGEIDEVYENEDRHKSLDYVFKMVKDGDNTLILCNLIKHLESTYNYIEKNFSDKYKIYVIFGKIGAKEREEIRGLMEKESNVILLATYGTMSTGVNIKRIHNIIFYASTKSFQRTLQSVGRGLRKYSDKKQLMLWDMIDDISYPKVRGQNKGEMNRNYLYKHWLERKLIYKNQEFKMATTSIKI